MPESEYQIVGNAWKKETSTGKVFLSISLKRDVSIPAGAALFLWPNDKKRPDKQDPDWTLSMKNE